MSWNENTMQAARYVCERIPGDGEEAMISAGEDPFWIPAKSYLDAALDEIQRLNKEADKDADERLIADLREWLGKLAEAHPRFSGESELFRLMLERFEADRKLDKWIDSKGAGA